MRRPLLILLLAGLVLVAVLIALTLFATGPADWGPPPTVRYTDARHP